jgi:5-hydroxyisourate hydrolase-like protein (transthyretin family)
MAVRVEVIDGVFGRPAVGVPVRLLQELEGTWYELAADRTDEAGHADGLARASHRCRYRLVLSLDSYFAGLGVEPFQSRVDVVFRVFHANEQIRLLFMVTPSSCSLCRLTVGDLARYSGSEDTSG